MASISLSCTVGESGVGWNGLLDSGKRKGSTDKGVIPVHCSFERLPRERVGLLDAMVSY